METAILVVDDDVTLHRALARVLQPLGCPILVAGGARHTRDVCASLPRLAAVIMDLDLGDGYGVDLIDELRELYGDAAPPFVILSGERPRRVPIGVVAVLSKPVGVEELLQTLKPLVEFVPGSAQGPTENEPRER